MKIKWILLVVAAIATLLGARAEDQTATARPPVVRAVEFKNFHGVSVKEIVNRLNDRDIRLVEEPYSKQYVATVQGIVEELMAEKGQAGVRVKPTVVTIPPHSVRVTFTAASD
jgi:outer membrane protein assembly factor BamA